MNRTAQREKLESVVCRFITGSPDAMYDIGVGTKTEWLTLKKHYPRMKLFGCEPLPETYRKLKDVFPGKLIRVAIGPERVGSVTLYLKGGTSNLGSASVFKAGKARAAATAKVWSLDKFDLWAGKPTRILLWIDIEGYELPALQSGPQLMASGRVKWLNLEVRDKAPMPGWTTFRQLDNYLKRLGYVLCCEYNNHGTHRDVIYKHKSEP